VASPDPRGVADRQSAMIMAFGLMGGIPARFGVLSVK
jgi:hypothetical protein